MCIFAGVRTNEIPLGARILSQLSGGKAGVSLAALHEQAEDPQIDDNTQCGVLRRLLPVHAVRMETRLQPVGLPTW